MNNRDIPTSYPTFTCYTDALGCDDALVAKPIVRAITG